MLDILSQLAVFASESFIVFIVIAAILILFFALLAKTRGKKNHGTLEIKNLNDKYDEDAQTLLAETLTKKDFKAYMKKKKSQDKQRQSKEPKANNVFVINFHGDMKASAVNSLSEMITTVLNVANKQDEVIVRIESAGGFVHSYGLAAAQLMRVRDKQIPLTITIDKIAASGGYLMACIGNKILSAPFAIIGSIGVLVQMPNFHRLLKDNHVDFIQLTAGEYKRTVTMFGENTEAGKEKLKQEIEEVHQLFKNLITQHRPQIDIQKVATGEHWLGQQAITLKLVDEIKTSDAYLLERRQNYNVFELNIIEKKSLISKLTANAIKLREKFTHRFSLYQ